MVSADIGLLVCAALLVGVIGLAYAGTASVVLFVRWALPWAVTGLRERAQRWRFKRAVRRALRAGVRVPGMYEI